MAIIPPCRRKVEVVIGLYNPKSDRIALPTMVLRARQEQGEGGFDWGNERKSKWEGSQSDPGEHAPAEEAPTVMDDAPNEDNPRVLELEALTRDLTERIYEMEDSFQRRDEEMSRLWAFNDVLVQRVAGLSVHICSMWVDQAASRAYVKRLHVALLISVSLLILLARKLLAP